MLKIEIDLNSVNIYYFKETRTIKWTISALTGTYLPMDEEKQ